MINVALYGWFFVLSEQTCDIFLGHDPQGHEEYNSLLLDLKRFFNGFRLSLFRSVYIVYF